MLHFAPHSSGLRCSYKCGLVDSGNVWLGQVSSPGADFQGFSLPSWNVSLSSSWFSSLLCNIACLMTTVSISLSSFPGLWGSGKAVVGAIPW